MAILPIQVINEMAKRDHRMSHFLFHGVRNSWERFNEQQRNRIRAIDPAWEPPRLAVDGDGNPYRDNNSGEDFLYMHREMIKFVNGILSAVSDPDYPKITGWGQLPEPDDADFPVIPMEGLEEIKSDNYLNNTLKTWEQRYKSTEYLTSVSLGQLGADLEFTIHNGMHMRWATPSVVGYRPRTPITQPVGAQWDAFSYDFLGDTYSSHVHPTFWKIHGWIDERIDDWKRANNVTTINWIGTWIGPMSHEHGHHFSTESKVFKGTDKIDHAAKMIEVAKVLAEVNFDGFLRPRKEDVLLKQ